MEFDNNSQGVYAESVFITECVKRRLNIYQPILDNHGVDFIVGESDTFHKIQVKSTLRSDKRYKNSPASFKMTIGRGANSRLYDEGDFDFCCVYIIKYDVWYIIPFDEIRVRTIRVNLVGDNCKYRSYQNAWHLLTKN